MAALRLAVPQISNQSTSFIETVKAALIMSSSDAAIRFDSSAMMRAVPQPAQPRSNSFVRIGRWIAVIAVLLCNPVQWFIDASFTNFFCTTIATLTAVATFAYVLRVERFRRGPFSSLMVLGFNVSALSGALLIQTLTLRAVSFNLESPYPTFTALAATQLLVILVHYTYLRSRLLQGLRAIFNRRVCVPMGLMQSPGDLQLWIFGLAGCAATVLSARNYTQGVEFGNVTTKFAVAYVPFAVAPFFSPMRSYLFNDDKRSRSGWIPLLIYALLLIAVAIVNNSRGTFSAGFLTLGLCFVIAVAGGNLQLTFRQVLGTLCIGVAAIPLFMGLSDLATAMVIARDERSTVSPTELIQITLENFANKNLLVERRKRDAIVEGGQYNENYIENPLFARFVYTKFVDVNMNNALSLSDLQARRIREDSWNRILATLPTPVLSVLHIDVDKSDLGFSSGDIYSYLARAVELGSYTTGSEIPDGLVIFGGFFWPFLAVMLILQFVIYDGFSKVDAGGRLTVSAAGLINVVPMFTLGVMQESVADQVAILLRGVFQLIMLYWLIYIASKLPLRIVAAIRLQRSSRSEA